MRSGMSGTATAGDLLALIRTVPPSGLRGWTRQELLAATGMSRPTLLDRLASLRQAELVYEAEPDNTTGGRPANRILFDDRGAVVAAIDVGHRRARVSVLDLAGTELRFTEHEVPLNAVSPAQALEPLLDEASRLVALKSGPGGAARVFGVGLGLPAPVSDPAGAPEPSWTLPGWDAYPLREVLAARWPAPAVMENDARALALGEHVAWAGSGETDAGRGGLLAVKWSSGIGAGLVVDGRALRGADGAAGDLGHIRVSADSAGRGPRCRCGRYGCLAAYASGEALLRSLGLASLAELAAAVGSPGPVRDAVTAAAELVGGTLAAALALANPRLLVLGGIVGRLPCVVDAVDRQVRASALSRSTGRLVVAGGRLGERAAVTGLGRLVVDRVLAPAAVDARLAGVPT